MTIHNDIEKFIKLKPVEYRFLKSIKFSRNISNEGCTDYDVELILGKIIANNVEYLSLFCENARDIDINNLDGMFGLLVTIDDIRDRQLEGISYRISEQENDAFSFNCSDFFVNLIK